MNFSLLQQQQPTLPHSSVMNGLPQRGSNTLNNHTTTSSSPFSSRSHSFPNEVFVGNLSYFCDETALFNLFQEYANVVNVRIVRTEDRSRSLLFGFVAFKTAEEVQEITRLLNNHLFLGRNMR